MPYNENPSHEDRDHTREIHRQHRGTFEVMGGCLIVAVLVAIGVAVFAADLPEYWQNVYVTLVGAALTVFVLDKRAEQRAIRHRKEELILQMGSPDNAFAIEAVRILQHKGWLTDGSLVGANLEGANLEGARLWGADIQGVDLSLANLKGAAFRGANLAGTICIAANLEDAYLNEVNLRGANFAHANLEGVTLSGADLRGTYIEAAYFSERTTLPNQSDWTPDVDWREFTDQIRTQ